MRARSLLVVIALCLVTPALHSRADLRALYDAHDWFALRDAVTEGSPPFYRGAVAYAFNDAPTARRYLDGVIAAAPASDEATEARGLLIYVHQREGHYRQALEQIRYLQKSVPDASGLKNAEALFDALSRYDEQSVVLRRRSRFRYTLKDGNLFIPLSINADHAEYIVDTGANFSVLSESEAKRLGLTITDSGATGTVTTGAQVGFRTAVAATLNVAGVRLRNVVFLVSADSNQPFVDLPNGTRGVLGIPVLLALETMWWSRSGDFEAGRPSARFDLARTNLCFEGVTPLVRAAFARSPISLVLDSGATRTDLGPAFAKKFPDALRGGTKHSQKVTGVGDSVTVDALSVPELPLELGGRTLVLRPANVLLEQRAADDRWSHGRLGIDSLRQASAVAIDFRAMTLRLQP